MTKSRLFGPALLLYFLVPAAGNAAECDRILVQSALRNSYADVTESALQLISREDFESLKAEFPQVFSDSMAASSESYDKFAELRSQMSRKLTFAYGLDSARTN